MNALAPTAGPAAVNPVDDLPRLIFEAVGAASMCWVPPPGAATFDTSHATEIAEKLLADVRAALAPAAVVYPPDGTVSPFTVINLGFGAVQMGDCIHDRRLPALWFGKNGQGMGHEEVMNREAHEGETLAVVTFANVEGLDVLASVIQRIRRVSFPNATADTLRDTLQRKCTDLGLYWRASDAHGVDCTVEQAADLLAQALGVEVNIAQPAPAERQPLTDEQITEIWGHEPRYHYPPIGATDRDFARAIEAAHGITAAPAAKEQP